MGDIQIWTKPVNPSGSFAFAFLNTGVGGTPHNVTVKLADLGLKASGKCLVSDTNVPEFRPRSHRTSQQISFALCEHSN